MVDHEVEETLREIRERVRAAAPAQPSPPAPLAALGEETPATMAPATAGGRREETLARMEANLVTTERAWSRLPPVLSYRRGAVARLELAVKRLVKRALHWFTWEQVNFNSAAHHALRDALAALSAQERQLAELRAELEALRRRAAEADARMESERARAEGDAARRHAERRGEIERARAELRGALERACGEIERARGEIERLGGGLAGLHAALPELRAGLHEELRAGLHEELGGELRERAEHLAAEQRVCFRQLSLEATEAAVAHDRARRLLEARLEELEKQSRER